MTYVRHRDRMIRESVYEDLRNTFIACRWLAGTTSVPVLPIDGGAPAVVTTTAADVLELLEGYPIKLIDAFPESDPADDSEAPEGKTAPNTFAMDTGRPGDPEPLELGNDRAYEKPYTFNYGFWAISDAVALAVMNDLADRYAGHIVDGDAVALYNYNGPDPTTPVVRMGVETFRYMRDAERVTASDVHLYFAELLITDVVYP